MPFSEASVRIPDVDEEVIVKAKYEEQTCRCPVQPGVSHPGSGLEKSNLCLAPPAWRKVGKQLTFDVVLKKKKKKHPNGHLQIALPQTPWGADSLKLFLHFPSSIWEGY